MQYLDRGEGMEGRRAGGKEEVWLVNGRSVGCEEVGNR